MLVAVAAVVSVQLLFTYLPPMQVLFGTAAIGWEAWARIVAFGMALFLLVELKKAIFRSRGSLAGEH